MVIRPEWMPGILADIFCEVMVFDAKTHRLLAANDKASTRLQLFEDWMPGEPSSPEIEAVIGGVADFGARLDELRRSRGRQTFPANLVRQDGSRYGVDLNLVFRDVEPAPVFVALVLDAPLRQDASPPPKSSEAHYRAILSGTPGLFFQMVRAADGSIAFSYLSDGCYALLGIEAASLQANPKLLLSCILEEDRPSYLGTMIESAVMQTAWNWEGRLRIVDWNDIKWVNLRATPGMREDGAVHWDGIMSNITQGREEQAELARSREQLARLGMHVEQVKEDERKRIARELHDDLGGNLTAIKMALSLLARRLPSDRPDMIDKATYLDQLVDRTIDAVHRIAGNLRPSVLDIGIVDAIQWQAREFEKQTGIACDVHSNVGDVDATTEESIALFRMFQEALTNVTKHAQANRVTVEFHVSPEEIALTIADDGKGLEAPPRRAGSFGILGMNERANAFGGTLNIYNAPTGGCIVSIRMPFGR